MAQDLLYTDDGDLFISKDSPLYVTGLDEIKQSLNLILLTKKGSGINHNVGLDYDWLIGGYDKNAAISAIENAIKQDKRVEDVVSIKANHDKSKNIVSFDIVVNTTLGQLDFRKDVNINAVN